MSRITGLLRESVMARLFGAGLIYDAFMLGFRIPNLTRDLFAEGALSSAFVPIFTEYLTTRSKEEAARLANLVATAIIIVVGAVCALGMIFAPRAGSSAGARLRGGARQIRTGRPHDAHHVPVPAAGRAGGAGHGHAERLATSSACRPWPRRSSISARSDSACVLGVWLGPYAGICRASKAWRSAWCCGGALQLVLADCPACYRPGISRFAPRSIGPIPACVRILRLMVPAILGNAAVQINVMVNTNFASAIHDPVRGFDGPVSWLGYAFRFMQLPSGPVRRGHGSATLPSISRSAAAGNMDEFRRRFRGRWAWCFC